MPALQSRFASQDRKTLEALFAKGQFIGGALLDQFETAFAAYCQVQHTIGTGNGLDALTLILKAEQELGKLPMGARILVPAQTYIATFLSIAHAGMIPVPVDVKEVVIGLSDLENLDTHYDGILVVDLYGKMVAESVYEYAAQYQKPIYCDSAQSHGAVNLEGKKAGSLARASAFSFYPTKNLGALGDGGAITTDDIELANCCRKLGNYGRESRYVNDIKGVNSRLDPLQAGFLLNRLPYLDRDNQRRLQIAQMFTEEISNDRVQLINAEFFEGNAIHVFPVLVEDRNSFVEYLSQNGIGSSCHYQIPPHQQAAFPELNGLSFPRTSYLHRTEVSLPCHPLLSDQEVNKIIEVINSYR